MAHRIALARASRTCLRPSSFSSSSSSCLASTSSSNSNSSSTFTFTFTSLATTSMPTTTTTTTSPIHHPIQYRTNTNEATSLDSESESDSPTGPNANWDQRIELSELDSNSDHMVRLPPHGEMASPELMALADTIVNMKLQHVVQLTQKIQSHFGIEDSALGGGVGGGGDTGSANPNAGEDAGAPVEEKTAFELKLTGFDAKSKIKVIKEIRSMTGLGLKEAKELVEGAPKTIKKDIKKEEAEELKAVLEAVGATVDIL